MNLFVVSFFGHRQVDDPFLIERQLEAIIRELLLTKEYIEFLVGRDGEFCLAPNTAITWLTGVLPRLLPKALSWC